MMNNEIKEILDRLDFNEWEVDLYKVPITWSELYDIRDYITNLQEENAKVHKELDYADNYNIYLISKIDKATEKLESIKAFGLRSGKTLFSTLINESIDILKGVDNE